MCIFFFKQKTAYEMRISDWSSDVCSSDLSGGGRRAGGDEMSEGDAGDRRPAEAWALLEKEPKAVLVDVRTAPEWGFVGVPRLDGIGKEALCISWQAYPTMARNENFVAEVEAKGIGKDQPVLLLCRSGARSRAAALAL